MSNLKPWRKSQGGSETGTIIFLNHNKRMVAKKALDLPIENDDEVTNFLQFAKLYLSGSDIEGVIKRTPIQSQFQGEYLLDQTNLTAAYSYVHPNFVRKNLDDSCKEQF